MEQGNRIVVHLAEQASPPASQAQAVLSKSLLSQVQLEPIGTFSIET
jgi:hypothetical protein